MSTLSPTEEVKRRINKSFEQLYNVNAAGNYIPYVCLICDELLKPTTMKILQPSQLRSCSHILHPSSRNNIDPKGLLAMSYTYFGDCGDNIDDNERQWIEDMLLSPRGSFIRTTNKRKSEE
jgi:hypothetical protein